MNAKQLEAGLAKLQRTVDENSARLKTLGALERRTEEIVEKKVSEIRLVAYLILGIACIILALIAGTLLKAGGY